MTEQELERLLKNEKKDQNLKQRLLKTRELPDPVEDFCSLCQAMGYDIKPGELMAIGQNSSDEKLRSVNGGGVNPIDGWDDAYEQFFMTLLWT